MKIMLIRPPQIDYNTTEPPRVGIPLGMLSIASALEQKGHFVKVFDSLIYLNDSEDKKHFGASWQRIEEQIKDFLPDMIGIANLFSTQIENSLELPRRIKKINPSIKIIIGGPHATSRPNDFLQTGLFDFVIIGEGEITAQKIADYFEGKIQIDDVKGVAYISNGTTKQVASEYIKDINTLPIPAYHLVEMKKYFDLVFKGYSSRPQDPFYRPRREITIITSRGCPYICTFCSIHPTMGYQFRFQTPEYVADHIEHVVSKYGVEFVHFEDDNLTLIPQRFEKVLDLLEQRGINIQWDTPNGVRADKLPKQLLEKMKKSGVTELRIAIESGVQRVLDQVVKKSLNIENAVETAKNCRELKIPLAAFFVIGMPGETKDDIKQTLDLAYHLMKEYDVTPHVNVAHPLVGTELYNTAKEKGYLLNDDYTKGFIFGESKIKTPEFGPEDLKKFTKEFYKKVKTAYMIKKLKNPKAIAKDLATFIRYPKSTLRLIKIASRYTS